MVQECTRLDMKPLTKEEFVEEERRMYIDLMNRRHGIYERATPNFSIYR